MTPRRTILLLAGFVLFGSAYLIYAQILGWLDGLPQLPAPMLLKADGSFSPPKRNESLTQQKLAEAFGEHSPETKYLPYETQLVFRSGDSTIVLAAGKPPSNPNSNRVTLAPFSIAIFKKPKPPHLRKPGEVAEISTIHADKGILEFDRIITSPADMRPGKAKLVRLELVSDYEQTFPDPRRGVVHITNNQRSSDPSHFLVLRTVGPVFYRDPKFVAGTPAAQGPDFWTDAPIEIVDRQNLPRPIGAPAPITVQSKGEDNRDPANVAAILNGQRLPPPTVTAHGMRVYLEPELPAGQKKKAPEPGKSAINGVRRIEFLEQVRMNLWVDNGQSLVGRAPSEPSPPENGNSSALAHVPPPAGIAAITGGLGPVAFNTRLMNRALLQIETRGAFAYDAEKSIARFDVVPHSDPNLLNEVQVTKVPARGGTSNLFSQVVEMEFNGGPTGDTRAANSPAIKKLHAWTTTPGRVVAVTSHDEAMEAYGQDLVHDQTASRTILIGAPLFVVRDRNILTAGTAQQPATLISEPAPIPPPITVGAPPGPRKTQVTVRGPGRVELFDPASKATTLTASWQTSLVQTKDFIGGREQDLFTLTDGAKIDDVKADYWLKGNLLKLWLEPRTATDGKTGGEQLQPSLVKAIGQVQSHSTDYEIVDADQLTVHISNAKPAPLAIAPPAPPSAPAVAPVAQPVVAPVTPKGPAVVAKEPEKKKPPFVIKAKIIETRVARLPAEAKADGAADAKYQLERARCDEGVTVHQDALDPTKTRGIDITARLLIIEGSADGNKMTAFGWPNRLGEVHQEEMSLLGPEIILNQVLNSAEVKGRGALTMPTNSDLAGTAIEKADVVVIQWRESMVFHGASRSAAFVGKVSARQGSSGVLCHMMNVVFDRPIYFNPAQKKAAAMPMDPKTGLPAAKTESAKIDKVRCYAAPADDAEDRKELVVRYIQVEYDKDGKPVKMQQLSVEELTMESQVQDRVGGEKYQRVTADGPGTFRLWQQGDKSLAGPAPGAPKPMDTKTTPSTDEREMKLTVVLFNGRMTIVDKGKVFQEATFTENIQTISVPATEPTMPVDRHNLPPRALLLTCNEKLVVSSHKQGNAAPVQRMDAVGNAYLRSDEYDGWGDTIRQEGKTVTFEGSETNPARIRNRFNQGNDQRGKRIIYDRAAGSYRVNEGFGGSIGPPTKK